LFSRFFLKIQQQQQQQNTVLGTSSTWDKRQPVQCASTRCTVCVCVCDGAVCVREHQDCISDAFTKCVPVCAHFALKDLCVFVRVFVPRLCVYLCVEREP